jgi:hypothetical protein
MSWITGLRATERFTLNHEGDDAVQSATGPHLPPDRHLSASGPGAPSDPALPAPPSLSLLPGAPPTAGATARRTYLEVEARPGVVPEARRFARNTLRLWGLSDAANDAELIVSELLANAIAATARMPFQAHVGW